MSDNAKLTIVPPGPPEGGTKMPGNAWSMMWEYLNTRYEFQWHPVKAVNKYRTRGSEKPFTEIDDVELNTMSLDMAFQGYKACDTKKIRQLIQSHLVPHINPITDYFKSVASKNSRGAIDKLAASITTTAPELWKKYLRKWLVACVAQAHIQKGCQNHTCLVLTGGQGKGKTTWLDYLCPPALDEYRFTGELDLKQRKDTVLKLAEYWLINIEEQLKNLNRDDDRAMKSLITLPDIKVRRPYAVTEARAFRLANFAASTNDDDFLTDTSGSRRYLCFHVVDIDLPGLKKIKIDEVWCEAFHLFQDKTFQYHIDNKTEQAELLAYNKQFAFRTQEYEYVAQWFCKPEDDKHVTHIAPATAVRDLIRFHTQNSNLKDKNIGAALKDIGCDQISHRMKESAWPIKAYKLKMIGKSTEPFDVFANQPF
jgi:predicted P-loop ATPase